MKSLGLWLLRLYLRTLRFEANFQIQEPLILGLWHADLLSVLAYFRHQSVAAMVSASKDGQLFAQFLYHYQFQLVYGSSSRQFHALRHLLQSQAPIWAMAMDGPRGPAGIEKAGHLWLQQHSHRPILRIQCHYSHSLRLSSWDRMQIPLPWTKIALSGQYQKVSFEYEAPNPT